FYSPDGEDAARSGRIGDNQQSYMVINATGPATVSFWWRVDSEEGYDFLKFEMDGTTLNAISGLVDWEEVTAEIPAGDHVLRWVYSKDEAVSVGADAGWVDEIQIFEGTPPPSLADALNTTNLLWSTTGDLPWFTQTS